MARSGEGSRSCEPVLWLLGVSFALHEAEEWNLVAWERIHFTPAPEFDDLAARTLLVLFAVTGLSFTTLSVRLLEPRGALFLLLPFFVVLVLGNALTHIFWLFYFGSYAPGVLTAALLLVPLSLHLVYCALRERLAPRRSSGRSSRSLPSSRWVPRPQVHRYPGPSSLFSGSA